MDPVLVKKAREEEMRTCYQREVYKKVPLQQCYDETGEEPDGWT